MIESIQLIGFQDAADCIGLSCQSRESFIPVNYTFKKGKIYGLISDFGCGSWGVATSLGGRCSENYNGKVVLDGQIISAKLLSSYACYVAEYFIANVNMDNTHLTTKECIKHALEISGQPFSVEDIKNIFCLSDARFERPLANISGEIWLASLAVNFALGKTIFCYPWLNLKDVDRFKIAYEHKIIDFMKKEGKIIIVPSSQKKILRKYCDHMICFQKEKIRYC